MEKDEKDKKSFILYSDLLDRIEMLTIEERGILFTHLLEYVNDKEPILTDRLLLAVWKPIELELKRNFKKYEEAKESKVIGGRLGNLKRWNPDLYVRVIDKKLSLEEAEKIAISRKSSHTDKEVSHTDKEVSHTDKEVSLYIASVAVDVDDNVDVDVDDNVDVDVDDFLLEKETKNNICEISEIEVLEYEEIKKEKSSAKKEKENKPDLNEFLEYAEQIIIENNLGSINEYKLAIEAKFEQWSNNDWKDGHGKPIKRWKPKLKTAFQYFKPIRQNGYGNIQQQSKEQPVIGRMSEETVKRNLQGW